MMTFASLLVYEEGVLLVELANGRSIFWQDEGIRDVENYKDWWPELELRPEPLGGTERIDRTHFHHDYYPPLT